MPNIKITFIAASLAVFISSIAFAQEVREREGNQQDRIGQGLQSGQITAKGAAHLESREAAINARRRTDLAANGGHLTPSEYRNLNRRENATSHQIFTDKHNNVAQPGIMPR